MATLISNPVIGAQICGLDKFITDSSTADEIQYAKNRLFDALGARFDDQATLSNYVYQDCDPLDRMETETVSGYDSFREIVRDIQLDIVADFDKVGDA